MSDTTILAMWSGPRNLSTAMMRSFGARGDCAVIDEPFYASYLEATGLAHPMREEVIAKGETDPAKVVARCLADPLPPSTMVYQKHMTHHMIEGFDTAWLRQVTNVFLIRDPARVLSSYADKTERVTVEDIGMVRQWEMLDQVATTTGQWPIVIDADDIRQEPETMLRALCTALGISFDPAMLCWKKGPRPEDGVWAPHWYDAIWNSTGFAPPETARPPILPGQLAEIESELRPLYQALHARRLRPAMSD